MNNRVVDLDVVHDSANTGITHCNFTMDEKTMGPVVNSLALLEHTLIELCVISIDEQKSKIELFKGGQKMNIDIHTKKNMSLSGLSMKVVM